MLESIYIDNYHNLLNFRLEDLERVNIFSGPNGGRTYVSTVQATVPEYEDSEKFWDGVLQEKVHQEIVPTIIAEVEKVGLREWLKKNLAFSHTLSWEGE